MSGRISPQTLLMIAGIGAAGYLGWKAYKAAGGAADWIGKGFADVGEAIAGAWDATADTVARAWDATTETLSRPVEIFTSGTPSRIIAANVTRPAVPAGSQSVQRPHVTDLPEGSYQAAAMFWSLHPDAVFYD